MSWISATADGAELAVRIVPNGSRDEVVGLHGEALKVRVQSPPVDGKANKALMKFLAKTLGVSKSSVEIVRGAKSRDKHIRIHGLEYGRIESILTEKL